MTSIIAGLRGLDRSRTLGPATLEAMGRVAACAWRVILEPAAGPLRAGVGAGDAALDALAVALAAGRAALPGGDLAALAAALAQGSAGAAGADAAEALALLVREFGYEAEAPLAAAVGEVAAAGLRAGWDSTSSQLISEGKERLAAAWRLLERAARHLPAAARGRCGGEAQRAACAALAAVDPLLAEPAMGLLGAWLEVEEEEEGARPGSRAERAWSAALAAVRGAPPPAVLDGLPSLLEAVRECRGVPATLRAMLAELFGSCAMAVRLEMAEVALCQGDEREIGVVLVGLAHCSRRLAARGR